MSEYFSKYPKIIYDNTLVTNILTRVKLSAASDAIFNMYYVQDGETPDIIAHKFYEDSEKHWIILITNNIFDVNTQFPLSHQQFISYLDFKYKKEGELVNRTGSEYAQIKENNYPFRYKKIIKTVDDQGVEDIKEIYIGEAEFHSPDVEQGMYTFKNSRIYFSQSKVEVSLFDYEFELNEKKKTIKILKDTYVQYFIQQFNALMAK